MTNTCPLTPYSKKTSPYLSKISPYLPKEFCPSGSNNYLLCENGDKLICENGDYLIF